MFEFMQIIAHPFLRATRWTEDVIVTSHDDPGSDSHKQFLLDELKSDGLPKNFKISEIYRGSPKLFYNMTTDLNMFRFGNPVIF